MGDAWVLKCVRRTENWEPVIGRGSSSTDLQSWSKEETLHNTSGELGLARKREDDFVVQEQNC